MKRLSDFIHCQNPKAGSSRTPLNSQPAFSVALDWLTVRLNKAPARELLHEVLEPLSKLLSDDIAIDGSTSTWYGPQKWGEVYTGLKGFKFYYNQATERDGVYKPATALLVFSGKVLAQVDHAAIAAWLTSVWAQYSCEGRRADPQITDHAKSLPLSKVLKACDRRAYRGASSSRLTRNCGKPGMTLYVGSRKSEAVMRCYDKTAESKGKVIGNRFEVELKRHKANSFVVGWLLAVSQSATAGAQYCADVVTGTFDFVSKADKNKSRDKRLRWWQDFISAVNASPLHIPAKEAIESAQQSIDWLNNQVAGTLAGLRMMFGPAFAHVISDIADSGDDRLNNRKRRMFNAADISQLCY